MLNNSMAELGCERPEVVLKLDRNRVPAGEALTGSFMFWRDGIERADNAIDVKFVLRAQLGDEVIEQKIDEFQTDPLVISEDTQIAEYPFAYRLPKWLPVSTHAIRYYLKPRLESVWEEAASCGEEYATMEAIIVQPNEDQARLLKAIAELGFHEKLDSRFWNGKQQEFDFVASKGAEIGMRELSVRFQPDGDTAHIHIHVDRGEPVSFVILKDQDLVVSLRQALRLK